MWRKGEIMKYLELANLALEQYDIEPISLEFLMEATNVFFLVHTADKNYVLKIFQEDSSSINDNLTEHFMIGAIKEKSNVMTPMVIENKDGSTITKITYGNHRGYKRVAVYEYFEGIPIDGTETLETFIEVGKVMAKMHLATENLQFPEHINPKRWDKVFYFENEHAVYHKSRYAKYITKQMKDELDELVIFLNERLNHFYETMTPRLIHGNLNPWNIQRFLGGLIVYDFEEVMLAYPVMDIAIFLYYYRYNENFVFDDILAAFLKGYSEYRPIPRALDEKNLEIIMIARRINILNYILTIRKDPSEYIELSYPKIKEYYLSYK